MPYDAYQLMRQALKEAEQASSEGEVPVGAVLATLDGNVIASAHNQPVARCDPCAHAEILAIRKAARAFRNYRMPRTVLAITIEPCPMCMGAAIHARIARVIFGAADAKAGAAGSVYDLAGDGRLNHRIEVVSGILENECRALMQEFFRSRRSRVRSG